MNCGPVCGAVPIPQTSCTCELSSQSCPCVNTQHSLAPSTYVAPAQLAPIATGNNFFAQPPALPQEFSLVPVQIPVSATPTLVDEMVQRDNQLRQAISEYNAQENTNFPFPDNQSNVTITTTTEPPAADFSGLPSIYFTPANGRLPIYPMTKTPTVSMNETSNQKPNSTRAHAFASETHWAILSERETENGQIKQERIPYHVYENEVCSGATLGRAIESDLKTVANSCNSLGCAAANYKLDSTQGKYIVVYLKNVDMRRQIPTSPYSCITVLDVPLYENVYPRETKNVNNNQQNDESKNRFVTVEPKGAY
ncbi:hypothetical protein M3Y96_00080700 [Aphelenchoides besseyi]|nr:hypothetical protein M3Y96_00080700 [Aphelenchoides besseyi]